MMPMIDVLVIEPSGSMRKTSIHNDLESYRSLLDGGWLEGVGSQYLDWFAYCDEEGKHKHLAPNPLATELAIRLGWSGGGDILVGTVIFTGPANVDGDNTDVPLWLVEDAGKLAGLT